MIYKSLKRRIFVESQDNQFVQCVNPIYVENWSLKLDFEILLRTVKVVLKKEGAY
jgi:lipopolysaccharide/colanic/teichoic acid biosynthesis glycosyltransferase